MLQKTKTFEVGGKEIILNQRELSSAAVTQRKFDEEVKNSLGFDIDITSLSAVSKSVVSQKFYELSPALYLPLRVGENAWAQEIITYKEYNTGGSFESGILNTGASSSRLAEADAGMEAVRNTVKNWGKQIGWSIIDLQIASRAGNWDLIISKERSRKKNWDLGIQRTAFLGMDDDANVKGLLTQSNVTANTSLITKYIRSMTEAELSALVETLYGAYRTNSSYTAKPTHFTIPEDDFNGLASPTSDTYPLKSKLQMLQEMFATVTSNPNFKILPCSYANKSQNATVAGLNKNRYALYNSDEDSLRMDIPVDYTNTLQNSINGFTYQNVGYGQFTGVLAYRPAEMLYLDWS